MILTQAAPHPSWCFETCKCNPAFCSLMSDASRIRSEEFLKISDQFQLGVLTTESSHPITAKLSEIAKDDIPAALNLLFEVDGDVLRKYREFVESGRARGTTRPAR